jgi:hypothetical protein
MNSRPTTKVAFQRTVAEFLPWLSLKLGSLARGGWLSFQGEQYNCDYSRESFRFNECGSAMFAMPETVLRCQKR